jgi:hypothetical protein
MARFERGFHVAKKTSSGAKATLDKDASKKDDPAQEDTQPADAVQNTDEDTVESTADDKTEIAEPSETTPDSDAVQTADNDTIDSTEDDAAGTEEPSDTDEANRNIEEPATDTTGTDELSDASDRDTAAKDDGEPMEDAGTKRIENAGADEKPASTLPAPAPQPAKGAGAGSMILGGIVAGAIGFAAAYFGVAQQTIPRDDVLIGDVGDLSQRVDEQSATIESLAEKVGGITNADDSALQAQVEALGTLSDRVAETEQRIDDLVARLADVEQRPVSESADAATIAAYENELNAAREEFAARRAELENLVEQAMQTETVADEAAVAAMQRAAISRIQAALDNGTGFSGAVAELQDTDVEVPEALTSVAESGVEDLSSLQERFPDAARAALDASRDVTGEGTGLKGFLKNQLGARSLEPREGDDPDAVLSRAEAAVRDGRLQDALAEMEALPEEGRAELSDWAGRAAERLEAVGAAQSLSETLN